MFEKLNSVPDLPGVYMFIDGNGKVIYVGKAKSLKKRLTSHFKASDPNSKSKIIVDNANDFEYVVVKNEREALITEAKLIKRHLPKFNVLLKDDKSYPYIVITEEEYPRVIVVREKEKVKGRKFGPFIPAKSAKLMKDLIEKVFKLRKCKELRRRQNPCIQYHIERCTAPCCNFVDKRTYMEQVKGVISFLEGNVKKYIDELYSEIESLSESLNFERAAILRDQLISLKNIYEKSSFFFERFRNCNVYYLDGDVFLSGVLLIVRNGVIYGRQVYHFEEFSEDLLSRDTIGTMWIVNTISSFSKPELVFSNFKVERELNVKVEGIPEEIIPLARSNLERTNLKGIDYERLSREFLLLFNLKLPNRIEVFDISTLQGFATVGSCIVWERGKLKKASYRKFKVRTVNGVDDYSSMYEVLFRRFKNGKSIPELVIVDGGIGHLKVAIDVRERLNLNFRVFSLAKKEEVVYADSGEVIKIKSYPEVFKFFTQLRDEAHRFAVTFNRDLRSKKIREEVFEGIKGIGKKRKELIERFYPSLNELVHVSPKELAKIGIPEPVAEKLIQKVRQRYGG
jgi:excinuclease ABC subunit C